MSINRVIISGNLTRNAELRRTQSGKPVLNMGVAVNDRRKNPQTGEYEDVGNFFDVECWMTDAQLNVVVPNIVKGARCAIVDGHIEQQRWQDQNGNNRSKVVIRVDDPIAGLLIAPPMQGTGAQPPYQQQPTGYTNQQQTAPQTQPQQGYAYSQQQPQQPAIDYSQSVYDDDIPF